MNKPSRQMIKKYMLDNWYDSVDSTTGEINDTQLAEDAAAYFNEKLYQVYYGDEYDIPEVFYEIAYDVAEEIDGDSYEY